jgi:hypothetical protein
VTNVPLKEDPMLLDNTVSGVVESFRITDYNYEKSRKSRESTELSRDLSIVITKWRSAGKESQASIS